MCTGGSTRPCPAGWAHGWERGACCPGQGDPSVPFCVADVSGIDWMVRHGRSLALSVAVNVAPSRLCAGRYSGEVQEMILSSAVADRVRPWAATQPSPRSLAHPAGGTQMGGQRPGLECYLCW